MAHKATRHSHLLSGFAILLAAILLTACTSAPQVPESSLPTTTPDASTAPTSTPTTAPTTVPTTVPPVTLPADTTSRPADEYIGTIFTRGQLQDFDNKRKVYWPGFSEDGERPNYARKMQISYRRYNTFFLGDDVKYAYFTIVCKDEQYGIDEEGNQFSYTASMLDTLKRQRVYAVFFVTLDYCKEHPDMVQRMIDEGHAIGNYGTHPVETPTMSVDQIASEITTLHQYVKENFGYTMTLYRPYNGIFSEQTFAVAYSLGYYSLGYSYTCSDGHVDNQPSPDFALRQFEENFHNGIVIQMHNTSSTIASILNDMIGYIQHCEFRTNIFRPY